MSETIHLSGDIWLDITLPSKGRLVIKKSETKEGPWPMSLISPWTGPDFKIRVYGETKGRYIRLYLTQKPKTISYVNI